MCTACSHGLDAQHLMHLRANAMSTPQAQPGPTTQSHNCPRATAKPRPVLCTVLGYLLVFQLVGHEYIIRHCRQTQPCNFPSQPPNRALHNTPRQALCQPPTSRTTSLSALSSAALNSVLPA